jgi:hypothetical protein
MENFQNEWAAKFARPLGLSPRPLPQAEASPDGWTSLTDYADVMNQGASVRVILFTATGFGRFVSVGVSVSPNAYRSDLVEFFKNLNFRVNPGQGPNAPPERQGPEAPGRTNPLPDSPAAGGLRSYIFTTPDIWTRQDLPDQIVLRSPVYSNGEGCQITALPFRPSFQPLGDEAIGMFRAIFRTDPLMAYPSPPPKLARGTSAQGWEYFTIRKLVGGQEGEARTMGAILLAANLEGQIATIVVLRS